MLHFRNIKHALQIIRIVVLIFGLAVGLNYQGQQVLSQSPEESQRIYLPLIISSFSFDIDSNIQPDQPTVPGLNGGPPRPVGSTIGPDGKQDDFVVNEVILHPASEADLTYILQKYEGVVLHDGTPMLITETGALPAPPNTSSGAYLIRVNLSRSSLSDLPHNMTEAGIGGRHLFSSNEAAQLVALLARERSYKLSPDLVFKPQQCTVCENSNGAGDYIDAATFPWMTEDNDLSAPGDQGLSIGVIHAWEYLAYMGLPPPPPGGSFITPVIAIIDTGFALDPITGIPLNGNLDYGLSSLARPMQADALDRDGTAGGKDSSWHGQKVFGVAAARPKNFFGWAGTGGEVVKPLLIRTDGTSAALATSIKSAVLSGANVINLSWGGECNWLCRMFGEADDIQWQIGFATTGGVIVVAGAGNDGKSVGDNFVPCTLNGVICVGAIAHNGSARSYSNFGAKVDIWAPDCIRTTVTPDSVNNVGLDQLPIFCGTSAATPFVAGIAGLMKALDPSLDNSQVQQILQTTVNTSATTVGTVADPKVTPGWIDAFRAVKAVKPNQPPVVTITRNLGMSSPRRPYIHADVQDPEPGGVLPGAVVVRFLSDRDGDLCMVQAKPFDCYVPLSLGTHILTAIATDRFGEQANASLTLSVTNQPPTATITAPISGIEVFESQYVNFQGQGSDPDGPVTFMWYSSQSGLLGTDANINVQLPVGVHTVIFTVTDTDGATAQDSIMVTVKSGPGQPTARILEPLANEKFKPGDVIRFEGEGSDPEDGVLPGSALRWSSDYDGFLGTGNVLDHVLSGPDDMCDSAIHHLITLEVTDNDGNVAIQQIPVLVGGWICRR